MNARSPAVAQARHSALVRDGEGNLEIKRFATAKEAARAAQGREFSVPSLPRALRPKMIEQLYGIPEGSVHFYCTEVPEADRLPSVKLPGRKSPTATHPTRGARLILVDDLEAWLRRYRTPKSGSNPS